MTATRKNVEFAKVIAYDREGDPYVYGGNWDAFDRSAGTDCSGCVVDELDAVTNGTAMAWSRHGLSTEAWRPPQMGGAADPFNGPFGTVMVDHPDEFPSGAAVLIALHHGPGGGENSHMWCRVDDLAIETNGDNGTVLGKDARNVRDTSYANNWWYLPGPITEDGTPRVTGPSAIADTLFADVSEFQVPADDSYPYSVLSIRVCDGTYQDHNFAANYAWMRRALDKGTLTFGIIYTYVRPGSWQANAATVKQMIDQDGGLHPRVALMLDVESGGNPGGDQSAAINGLHDALADYAGSPSRIIGYGNVNDLNTLWPTKPPGIALIVAAYGTNPDYPGKVAHQYTDGQGYGGGLPEGCPPFGACDMNSADGLNPDAFAAACGIQPTPPPPPPPPTPAPPDYLTLVYEQLAGPIQADGYGHGWPQLGNRTLVDAVAELLAPTPVTPTKKGVTMPETVSVGGIKSELDKVVGEATSLVDLVDKYASVLQKYAGLIPGVGSELALLVGPLHGLDSALHVLQNLLKA